MQKLSSNINNLMGHAPYTYLNQDKHGFHQGRTSKKTGGVWSDEGTERLDVYDYIKNGNYTETYEPKKSDVVSSIAYDPERKLLKVVYVKSGKKGNIVVYDHVEKNVFEHLKESPSVGSKIWDLLRVRGLPRTSRYMYTVMGDKAND